MADKGYLVIADVTGYTAFLSKTELEHAHEILQALIEAVINQVKVPLLISRLQGDAVITYALDQGVVQGQTLLEAVEKMYYEFTATLENMQRNTSCTCTACALMPELDLKIVMHYGTFTQQKLGNYIELLGNDVNLAHRLLKNEVTQKTGASAYLLLTEAAANAINLDPAATATMIPHTESYEHIGEVKAYVQDMKPLWHVEREKRRVLVTREEAVAVLEIDLPVDRPLVWEYLMRSDSRSILFNSDSQSTSGQSNGRLGEGAVFHCAHGDTIVDMPIHDWRPFDYHTISSTMPHGTRHYFTVFLDPIPDGTCLTMTAGKAQGASFLKRQQSNAFLKKDWTPACQQYMQNFKDFVLEELAQKDVSLQESGMVIIPREDLLKAVEESTAVLARE
jgi:hypothetical protein